MAIRKTGLSIQVSVPGTVGGAVINRIYLVMSLMGVNTWPSTHGARAAAGVILDIILCITLHRRCYGQQREGGIPVLFTEANG